MMTLTKCTQNAQCLIYDSTDVQDVDAEPGILTGPGALLLEQSVVHEIV